MQRGYNYSPFWMTIDWVPLGRADRVAAGVTLGVAFMVSLTALPPPLARTETALRFAAALSTMVVFAIERANPDLAIFILVILMLSLLRRSLIARVLGYCIVFLLGVIKYYPFILLGLLAQERFRVGIPIVLASVVGLVLFWDIYAAQILEGLPNIAHGSPFGDMFGAKNFPIGMALIVQHITGSWRVAAGAAVVTIILLVAVICWEMVVFLPQINIAAALHRLDKSRRLALLTGALLLSGCFFAGQSVGYRGIFLLLVLPGLFALGRDCAAGPMASIARSAALSIPFLMWTEAIRTWVHIIATEEFPPPRVIMAFGQPLDFLAWCGREIVWWLLVVFMVIIILGFLSGKFQASKLYGNVSERPHP